jgi:cytoskeleton protein RodZ
MPETIGEKLHAARTERGIELSEVERATKIRVKFLEAMEEDRWEALPAPAYARGFLDIYARFLGLDERALLDEYAKTEQGQRHAPIPQSVIKPGALKRERPIRPTSVNLKPVAKLVAGVLAIVVLGLVIVGSIGGSDNGGDREKRQAAKEKGGKAGGSAASTTTDTVAAGPVSLELRSTADVWVCLVDDAGRALVNGETLSADESRGPFSGDGFEVTLGNGSVEMTVDGEPEQIPAVAEPLGYRITPTGVRDLPPSSQPTCL